MSTSNKETEKQPDLEVIETDEAGKPLNAPPPSSEADEEDDRRLSAEADDKDEDDKDDKPDADPERERIRQERKLRRKIMKDLRREERQAEKKELEELRRITAEQAERLRQVEAAQTSNVEGTLKERLQQALNIYKVAEEDVGLAIEAGDGKKAREALKARDEAREAAQAIDLQLRRLKAQGQQQERVGPDPNEQRYYQEWLSKNPWYDPAQRDEDSKLALAINQTLLQEGFRPNTPAFWTELTNRTERVLRPKQEGGGRRERDADAAPAPKRGGPPVGGSGREAAPSNKLQVFVTPERRRALEEAGKWDDPVAREKMLRRYAEHDRNNRTTAR